ncbi:lipopolysaccharide biosynthesis protein [Vibrio sp. qd031]|uniref:lipopolysaccharide biosynthesis protein n=1 Tax=Vibrio sp. qd031 TaxID=1603038 RepID=UPI000A0F91D5|nr:lipopolysaccharide biosynthesis protein [Vibrio sp. qd031]ORT51881.1 lipopolysaccharide biosynthesis protein [Vibrio sp. qd031]
MTVEQQFQELKNSLSTDDFNSISALEDQAKKYEDKNPELAKRILRRVVNLKAAEKTKQNNEVKARASSVKPQAVKVEKFKRLKQWLSPSAVFVLIPTLIFACYQLFIATERYESQAQLIVQQPDAMATMDASMALLSGLGVQTSGSDTELVKAYIYSNDMLSYLDSELSLREHYSWLEADKFSRLDQAASREELLEFYKKAVKVEISDKSGVITVYSQAFDSNFAQNLTQKIVERAEWYINSIGHQLAEAQLVFINGEHQLIEDKLSKAQANLLLFQQQYNLLDPTAEGLAMQQITYGLEGQIAAKEAELKTVSSVMSKVSPQVLRIQTELLGLKEQLAVERGKLAKDGEEVFSVSEIMAQFTDLKIKMELALQAYTASQVSLDKSRIEAYRQMKFLVVVESATLPEDNKYPDVIYNITLFFILASMLFAIGRIIVLTIRELK